MLNSSWEFAHLVHMCFVDLEKGFHLCRRHISYTSPAACTGAIRSYKEAGMRVSITKPKAMVLNWRKVICCCPLFLRGDPRLRPEVSWGLVHEWGNRRAWNGQADRCRGCCPAPLRWRWSWTERWSSWFTEKTCNREPGVPVVVMSPSSSTEAVKLADTWFPLTLSTQGNCNR